MDGAIPMYDSDPDPMGTLSTSTSMTGAGIGGRLLTGSLPLSIHGRF